MSIDTKLRQVEKQMAESPGDSELIRKWMSLQMKLDAKITTKWKIKQGDKYLSLVGYYRNTYGWTKKGKSFDTQQAAINCLLEASKKHARWNSATNKIKNALVVEQQYYMVENLIEMDLEAQQDLIEYEKLQKEKEQLEQQEQELLNKLEKQREKLQKREVSLTEKCQKNLEKMAGQ